MTGKKRMQRIDGLAAEIVKSAETASNDRIPAVVITPEEIARLSNLDYGRALRACLSRAELREIVSEAKREAWPHLNDDTVRRGSMNGFAGRAWVLGGDFRIAEIPGPSGLPALRFYLG